MNKLLVLKIAGSRELVKGVEAGADQSKIAPETPSPKEKEHRIIIRRVESENGESTV